MIHIIGAGPAGLTLGSAIKEHAPQKKVVIYEEHEKIGQPIQCTGILTPEIWKIVELPEEVIANRIWKTRIYAPNVRHVTITFKEPDVILWRDRFDQWLALRAMARGCMVRKGWKLEAVKENILHFTVDNKKRQVRLAAGDIVAGCDGPNSRVAKDVGLFERRSSSFGIQATVKIKHDNAILFSPFIGSYAWLVPESDSVARIGVDAEQGTKEIFATFLKRFKGKVIARQAGFIPRFSPGIKKQTARDGISFFLVGDAAGQVKNTTGGGIIAGMKAATILGRLIVEGREQRYTQAIKGPVTRELYLHYLVRKRMERFSDEDWNRLIARFRKKRLQKVLSEVHRDNIAGILPRIVVKDPLLFLYAFR